MSTSRFCALLICVVATPTANAATVLHSEALRGYDVAARAANKLAIGEPTTLTFNAFSRDFTLELEPNARLAKLQTRLGVAPDTGAYRGTVAGRAGSWARIVLTPLGPSGIVFDGDTLYGIESGSDSAMPGAPAMFRLADVYFAPGELGCEIGGAGIDAAQAMHAMKQEFPALAAAGATNNLDLGAVADFEFQQTFGAATDTALLTRFNNVDGIFSEQLGVQITVATVNVFSDSNDPFTTSAASALLDELAEYRGATPTQDAQGLTHLFTGRDLDGTTAGIAYLGAVCAQRSRFDSRSFGAGLSEGRRGAVLDSLVAAHEIGHNFGAPHDGDANAACASTPPTFLMAPSVNGSDRFSACSITQMQAEIASADCLTPIGAANAAVTLPPLSGNALAGVAFDHVVTVANTGVDTATAVTFTAAAEFGLTIVNATAAGTSCTVANNTASCAVGTLAGGVSRGVTLNLRPESVGAFDLTATVAAASDANASDNNAAITITAVPAVDLVVAGTATSVQVDQQTTINATLDNTGEFGATGVAVVAVLTAGLRPDSATLGGTACAVAAQTVTCPPQTLAAHATTVALVIAATGVTAGSQQVTITATANEAERTPTDNQRAIALSVTALPGSDDGGGGALSWWVAAFLSATLAWQRREKKQRRRQSLPAPLSTN